MESKGVPQYLCRSAAMALMVCTSMLAQRQPALAASLSDPVIINDCHINNSRAYISAYKPLAITFSNRRPIAADEVHFTVEYGAKTAHIVDTGTFSQNIGIHHAFDAFTGLLSYGFSPKRCTVNYVHFMDGTVWTPKPPPTATSAHH